MRGEKLFGIVTNEDGRPADWPPDYAWTSEYFLTDRGVYKYDGDVFLRQDAVPAGRSVPGVSAAFDQVIREINKDDDTGVAIIFETGDVLEFYLSEPTTGTVYCFHPASDVDLNDAHFRAMKPISVR